MTRRLAFAVMGTMGSIAVARSEDARLGAEHVDRAVAEARAELALLEHRFSHFRVDSEISRWAAGQEVSAAASADIEHVLLQCGRLHADSDGVFRARNPRTGSLDTAGYVKGYAIGRAVAVLRGAGLRDLVVGVGGDAYCSGTATADRSWRVAIQDPTRTHGVLALVDAHDLGVATSGRSERGDHIWHGERSASTALLSFTVVGPDIAEADAYATVGFAMGEAGIDWVRAHDGYRSIAVLPDGAVRADAALVSAG